MDDVFYGLMEERDVYAFYGFTDEPFKNTPDPKFLYLSETHRKALDLLKDGLSREAGVRVLTGTIGTGKTLLLQTLVRGVDDTVHVPLLANPHRSFLPQLKTLCSALGVVAPGETPDELSDQLCEVLKKGGQEASLVILDEAHNASEEMIEQLCELAKFVTSEGPVLHLILAGRPDLHDKLTRSSWAPLQQRVRVHYELMPLTELETNCYIETRVTIAGAATSPFTPDALEAIYAYSQGLPRLINILCDLGLFLGFGQQQHEIDRSLIRQAAASLHLVEPEGDSDYSAGHRRESESAQRHGALAVAEPQRPVSLHPAALARPAVPRRGRANGRGWRRLGRGGMRKVARRISMPVATSVVRSQSPCGLGTLLFRMGFASLFLVNGMLAFVQPEGFARIIAQNALGQHFSGAMIDALTVFIGVNDTLLGVLILSARLRTTVYVWSGVWFLTIAGIKVMNVVW